MTIYIAIAFVPVILKIYLGIASRNYSWADSRWYFLICCFLIQNLTEFIGYLQLSQNIPPLFLLKTYYVSLIALLVSIYYFIYDSSSKPQKALLSLFSALALLLSVSIILGQEVIAGYQENTYPVIAIKGPFFQSYLIIGLMCLAGSFATIIANYLKTRRKNVVNDQLYQLFALTPFFLVVAIIGLGMVFGFEVNGSGYFPVASTLFMLATVKLRLMPSYLISRNLPYTDTNRLSANIGASALTCVHGSLSLKEMSEKNEAEVLSYAIKHYGRNKNKIASYLGLTPKTLDRKLKKYGLFWYASNHG